MSGCPDDVKAFRQSFSWFYYGERPDGPLAFHFGPKDMQGAPDYALLALQCPPEEGSFAGLYRAYVNDALVRDPALGPFIGACGGGSAHSMVSGYQDRMLADADWGAAHERGAAPYRKELLFAQDVATLAGPGGTSTVVATVGVPVSTLVALPGAGGRYKLRALLVVTDTVSGTTERAEVRAGFSAGDAVAGGFRLTLQVHAPPSPGAIYRLRLEQPGAELGAVAGAPRAIPDYSGARLTLSDMLLADAAGAPTWQRQGARLALSPIGEFRGGRLVTYYEVYNLPADARYDTDIRVEPAETGLLGEIRNARRRDRVVRLSFHGEANAGGVQAERREIETRLAPGRYRMSVRVRTADGQSVERTRVFVLP